MFRPRPVKSNMPEIYVLVLLYIGAVCVQGQLVCPLDGQGECVDGLYPDPNDCGSYYQCVSCTSTPMMCPPTQHFNPHSEQCVDPSDARCDGTYVTNSLFTVARQFDYLDGPDDVVQYQVVVANNVNPFDTASQTVLTGDAGIYFYHLSAGARPGETLDFRLDGLPFFSSVYSNNPIHAIDVQTRDVMATLDRSTTLKTSIGAGASLHADASRSTMWTGFRLQDYMSETVAFSAETTTNFNAGGNIVFDNVRVSTGNSYNSDTGVFTASSAGRYLFSFTSGVASDDRLQAHFESNVKGQVSTILRGLRSENISAIDTLSKSILVDMAAGESMAIALDIGSAVTAAGVTLSFSGFLYAPPGGMNRAWAAFRTTASGTADPLAFDIVSINDDLIFNPTTNEVEISESGYYFITITGGTSPNSLLDMPLFVTDNDGFDSQLMAIYRSDDIGIYFDVDTIGRSVVVHLTQGERVRLAVRLGELFSNDDKLVSFCGFLLHSTA